MDDPEAAIRSLLKLPSVIGWARHNKRRLDDTAKRLFAFAIRPPRHSLQPVYSICSRLVLREMDLEEALEAAKRIPVSATRISACEVVPAFALEIKKRQLEAVKELQGFELPYPIGRRPDGGLMLIPIRPAFIVIEGQRLTPIFLIAWATLALDDFQKQLISSIITRALLTHQYFVGSDAEILCFPRIRRTKVRDPVSWMASDYDTLSDEALAEQFQRYSKALQQVIERLRGE